MKPKTEHTHKCKEANSYAVQGGCICKPQTEHTPLPWYASGTTVWGSDGSSRNTVASTVCCGSLTKEADEANAAYIVKCVNAHESLIDTLKHITRYADKQVKESPDEAILWAQLASIATEAIAAAKKGE